MVATRIFTVLIPVIFLLACAPPQPWNGTDVTGMLPDLEFDLVDANGENVNAERFRGKTTLLFFGFTNCPGPCPTTLAHIGVALDDLRELGTEVQVLMVSVDPERDSPEAMGRFTDSFGPWLHGLTGPAEELKAVKETYKVYAEKLAADAEGNYDVAHSIVVLAFDSQLRSRLLLSDVTDHAAVATDLVRLVSEDS